MPPMQSRALRVAVSLSGIATLPNGNGRRARADGKDEHALLRPIDGLGRRFRHRPSVRPAVMTPTTLTTRVDVSSSSSASTRQRVP